MTRATCPKCGTLMPYADQRQQCHNAACGWPDMKRKPFERGDFWQPRQGPRVYGRSVVPAERERRACEREDQRKTRGWGAVMADAGRGCPPRCIHCGHDGVLAVGQWWCPSCDKVPADGRKGRAEDGAEVDVQGGLTLLGIANWLHGRTRVVWDVITSMPGTVHVQPREHLPIDILRHTVEDLRQRLSSVVLLAWDNAPEPSATLTATQLASGAALDLLAEELYSVKRSNAHGRETDEELRARLHSMWPLIREVKQPTLDLSSAVGCRARHSPEYQTGKIVQTAPMVVIHWKDGSRSTYKTDDFAKTTALSVERRDAPGTWIPAREWRAEYGRVAAKKQARAVKVGDAIVSPEGAMNIVQHVANASDWRASGWRHADGAEIAEPTEVQPAAREKRCGPNDCASWTPKRAPSVTGKTHGTIRDERGNDSLRVIRNEQDWLAAFGTPMPEQYRPNTKPVEFIQIDAVYDDRYNGVPSPGAART